MSTLKETKGMHTTDPENVQKHNIVCNFKFQETTILGWSRKECFRQTFWLIEKELRI